MKSKAIQEPEPLLIEALKLIVEHQQASSSLLQRKLKIGYVRAGKIMDQLEQAGFVGAFRGSEARNILLEKVKYRRMTIFPLSNRLNGHK